LARFFRAFLFCCSFIRRRFCLLLLLAMSLHASLSARSLSLSTL
jgi:hypothetical protein